MNLTSGFSFPVMSLLKMHVVLCHSGYIFVISLSRVVSLLICCQCVHSGYHTFLAMRQTTEMTAHGSMKAFNPHTKDWTIYAEWCNITLWRTVLRTQASCGPSYLMCAALQPTNCCVLRLKAAKWTRSLTTN